ncbi:MAG: hypothetical protein ACI80V_003576 [Rhodothermales bacterium]|jgi:hypothetical protein
MPGLRGSIAVLILVILAGCQQNETREIVVSDSLLIEVLADLHLVDARNRLPDQPANLRDSVFVYHKVDSAAFREAMDGFIQYPEELTNLYNSVLDRLNASRQP